MRSASVAIISLELAGKSWQSQFDQNLVEGEQTLNLNADETRLPGGTKGRSDCRMKCMSRLFCRQTADKQRCSGAARLIVGLGPIKRALPSDT